MKSICNYQKNKNELVQRIITKRIVLRSHIGTFFMYFLLIQIIIINLSSANTATDKLQYFIDILIFT